IGDADSEGHGGVEDAGSVKMDGQTGLYSSLPDLFIDWERRHGAAGHVVRVLKADKTSGCAVVYFRRDGCADLRPGENTALAGNCARQAARERRHHRHLPVENMRASFADDLLTVLRMEADGDLIAHSSSGNEDGGLAAEDLGGARFQTIDGGVFAINIIANFGSSHCRPHRGGGTG